MDNETLRKAQLVMLEIGKEIRRVCEENGIRYFLDGGTLLGAVRHGGFIPWDDDMDIGMLREEYEKFVKTAPGSLGPEYFLQTWDTDDGYPYAFAKVRKLGTVYDEALSRDTRQKHREIWVDVFPYDVYPDDAKERKKQGRRIMLYRTSLWMKGNVTPWANHTNPVAKLLVHCKYIPSQIYAAAHSREKIRAWFEAEMRRYNGTEQPQNYFEESGGAPYGTWVLPAKCLEQLQGIQFEGEMFSGPKDYDLYLRTIYGDYMKLPPVEKRGNRHHIVEVRL